MRLGRCRGGRHRFSSVPFNQNAPCWVRPRRPRRGAASLPCVGRRGEGLGQRRLRRPRAAVALRRHGQRAACGRLCRRGARCSHHLLTPSVHTICSHHLLTPSVHTDLLFTPSVHTCADAERARTEAVSGLGCLPPLEAGRRGVPLGVARGVYGSTGGGGSRDSVRGVGGCWPAGCPCGGL